ncbi:DUF2798 domain-containing protein [Salmonella enterica subsp. enterica]|nr:DUF2798 domain-containing protein [Salmonella enterica subsp. enterica]
MRSIFRNIGLSSSHVKRWSGAWSLAWLVMLWLSVAGDLWLRAKSQ